MDKHLISSEYSDKSPKLNVNLPFIVHGQDFCINSIMDNMGECFKKILWKRRVYENKNAPSELIWTHSGADQLKPTNPDWVQKRPSAQKIHRRK